MRLAILLALSVLLSASVRAQDPSVPPTWRLAAGGGFVPVPFSFSASLSADRSWRGPLALGGRGWAITSTGYVSDGPYMTGGGGEGFMVARTQGPWLDLRASLGLGVAVVDYGVSSIGCEPEFDICDDGPEEFSGIAPYGLVGLGVDIYPTKRVGVGGELRGALMNVPSNVSTVEVGLRVRLAR